MPNETFKRRSAASSPRIARTASIVMTAGLWVGLAAGCWREVEFGTCNDGTEDKDADEECDDGRDNQDPATARPGACTWECKVQPGCGDMRVDTDEECDAGPEGSGRCTKDCQRTRVCVDEFVDIDIGEECDKGEANQALKDAMPDACTVACKEARCGNGDIEHGEECDDGDDSKSFKKAKNGDCTTECRYAACGDAKHNADEGCDWGQSNKVAEEAEYGDCTIECKHPQCGDGTKNADEECDDGNAVLTDECPSGPGGDCKRARCGDGWTQAKHEECDDGNDDEEDSCKTCVADKFVFITEGTWPGGELGGLTGADEKCQKEANDATLEGRYMAWLSDSNESPSSRFKSELFTGRYLLAANRGEVAVGWEGLTSGMISTPILVHADGSKNEEMDGVRVWTNTNGLGQIADATSTCSDWGPGADGQSLAVVGNAKADVFDAQWTNYGSRNCESSRHLYCFGVSPIEVQP